MPAITLQSIIDRAAAIADMHDDFVQPQTWVDWYNVEARALLFFMARNGWISNFADTADAGAAYTITLTGQPYAVLGVYEVRDGRYRPLRFKDPVTFARQDISTGNAITGDAQEYSVFMSENSDELYVDLYPRPTSGTYRALYLNGQALRTVSDLATTVQWPLNFEERIVLGMAKRALIKEESDTRNIERLIQEEEQRIEEFCWSRNLAEAPTVRNTDKLHRGWNNDMIYGPYESWYWL